MTKDMMRLASMNESPHAEGAQYLYLSARLLHEDYL